MKTSIFDMTFTLPPLIEMTQVEKDMPSWMCVDFLTLHPGYVFDLHPGWVTLDMNWNC